MRAPVPLATIILAGVILVQAAAADPVGRRLEITPFGGYTLFDGHELVNGNPVKDDLYIGGRLGYQLHPLFGLEAAAGFTPTAEEAPGSADVDFYHFSANLLFSPWGGYYGGPFLVAGAGSSQLKAAGGSGESSTAIEVGGGVRLWISDRIGLRFEARQIYHKVDEPREVPINHLVAGGGLTFAIGAQGRDTDGDGVSDRKDTCPNTARGARVDANGCPKDSDGDGVWDGIDQCDNTPKGCAVDARGCPSDSDGDGVCDGPDQCADTPKGATVDDKGCPKDSDGDAVLDGIDQCPDTPKGATVDAKGCPSDSDGDGVANGIDQCPDTSPGLRVDVKGCPIEVMDKETELLDTGMIRLQNVNFQTAKADVLAESFPVLDVVGQVLKQWPELRIEIGGHTDARGSNAANQKLSEARARSVLAYLTQKFPDLKPEQFTAKGYGESKPLVPNTNDLNMAKNRRVEFLVLNKDVLRRERERRRLLRKDEVPIQAPAPLPAPVDTSGAPPDTTRR